VNLNGYTYNKFIRNFISFFFFLQSIILLLENQISKEPLLIIRYLFFFETYLSFINYCFCFLVSNYFRSLNFIFKLNLNLINLCITPSSWSWKQSNCENNLELDYFVYLLSSSSSLSSSFPVIIIIILPSNLFNTSINIKYCYFFLTFIPFSISVYLELLACC